MRAKYPALRPSQEEMAKENQSELMQRVLELGKEMEGKQLSFAVPVATVKTSETGGTKALLPTIQHDMLAELCTANDVFCGTSRDFPGPTVVG